MLRIIYGKAGAGKTAHIIGCLKKAVDEKKEGLLYIIPEQYSHEAEREFSAVCGDAANLYAEVVSFTGLARKVAAAAGGSAARYLDDGGRLLTMAAVTDLLGKKTSQLKYFKYAAGKSEIQELLLGAIDEFTASGVSPEALADAAEKTEGALSTKLSELALIYESYIAAVRESGAECGDRLFETARLLEEKTEPVISEVYIDGFSDFTKAENEVIRALLRRGTDVTLSFTCDSLETDSEAFAIPAATARYWLQAAKEDGLEPETELFDARSGESGASALEVFSERMFIYSEKKADADGTPVRLFVCPSAAAECELAAAEAIRLVRTTGCRWRDIAVAVRGFDKYAPLLKSIFEYYGVPLFTSERTGIAEKPLPSLIASAYEIEASGWSGDDVISYMHTGLTGLTREECDELENYIFKWQLRERDWHRCGTWRQHPNGYKGIPEGKDAARLAAVNASAVKLYGPLSAFIENGRKLTSARKHCRNLAAFLTRLDMSAVMEARYATAEPEAAEELNRIWNITVEALEQCESVLGDTELKMSEFGKLFVNMLSKYTLGRIPATLDSVSAGDFDRMRRRNLKHLIVLGASDDRLPMAPGDGGIFSLSERDSLRKDAGIVLDAGESELWREFWLIYSCLSLPSDSLTMSYAAAGEDGAAHPAYVMLQAKRLFGKEIEEYDLCRARLSAEAPALALAADALSSRTPAAIAAANRWKRTEPERLTRLLEAARRTRGSLSPDAVRLLYGENIRISASKTDLFANCPFGYFCRYGLKAEPYETATFRPVEIGSFMHDVFEKTAKKVSDIGGFKAVDNETLFAIADAAVDDYICREIGDFEEKSARFVYLFNRLRGSIHRILSEAAEELRNSDFEPVSFELDFSDPETIPPFTIKGEGAELTLSGIADRVDMMEKDGKKYIRVVDYKTGDKKLVLSDIYYGVNLQMLLYLMALERNSEKLYDGPVTAAGVYYFPALDKVEAVKADSEEKLEAAKKKTPKRSGLVLTDPAVLAGWDRSEDGRYSLYKVNSKGELTGDGIADRARLELLEGHVRHKLLEMSGRISDGEISASPLYAGENDNACTNCSFRDACGFLDGTAGECARTKKKLSANDVWDKLEAGNE